MFTSFDWLRTCSSGNELLAVMILMKTKPGIFYWSSEPGCPMTAIAHPCRRCWTYPKLKPFRRNFCLACEHILRLASRLKSESQKSVLVWGHVNQIPKTVLNPPDMLNCHTYLHDERSFLIALTACRLRNWLQDVMIHHSDQLKGVFQIFPPVGITRRGGMGDVLCKHVADSTGMPSNRLWIRFFPKPYDVFNEPKKQKKGLVPLEVDEFMRLLDMASIFRTLLTPKIREILLKILTIDNDQESQFYWGRLTGMLTPESKDMLDSWKIRRWPMHRFKFLYDLTHYVPYPY